jgi:hypothetical protein
VTNTNWTSRLLCMHTCHRLWSCYFGDRGKQLRCCHR